MTKKHVVVFTGLALTAFAAYAASVPNLFSAGDPARAADVNANFTALANAVTALEAKVAALESTALTATDVVGTWKFMSLTTATGSLMSTRHFTSESKGADGTFIFLVDGTVTITQNERSNRFDGKAQQCASGAANTSNTNPGGNANHNHQYTAANCDQNADAFNAEELTELDQTGTGTWALGSANTVVVTFQGDPPFTIYMSKRGGTGHSSQARSNSNSSAPGREFRLAAYVKQ